MAKRKIVTKEDEVLHKKCRHVEKFDKKLWQLLDDMAETMYHAQGYGLAAPQIGVLRRVAVIDVGEGLLEVINPTLFDCKGKQRDVEGCLSCPNEWGYVVRPMTCKLKAQDRHGNEYEKELSGLFCRCACHETEHLDGKLFLDLVDQFVIPEE